MAVINKIFLSKLEFAKRIDGELYNPRYKDSYNILLKSGLKLSKVSQLFFVKSGSTPPDRDDELKYGPILFKTTDIRNKVLNPLAEYYHISPAINKRMRSTQLKKDDVLLNIVGATLDVIGRTAYFTDRFEDANITQAMVFLRQKSEVLPGYLFAYLNTKYAQDQIKRFARPTGQFNLNLIEVGAIELPIICKEVQNHISSLVQQSGEYLYKSSHLFTQASKLLDEALGLKDIQFKKEKSYKASFSEVITNNRADADFFQTKYKQLASHLDTIETLYLGSICQFKKGVEVGSTEYKDDGVLFIRVSNITRDGISTGNADKFISNQIYNKYASFQPNAGDILLTKDGTIGTCYVLDEDVQGLISSGILNLTLLNPDIPKEYLALVISSKICQMQAQRDCSGALILHWKPKDVRKLRIPILAPELMEDIAEMAANAKSALRQSKALLEQAKNEVETLIEQANE